MSRRRRKVIPFPVARTVRPRDEPAARELVDVHRCEPSEAVVVRALLESEAIPTVVRSHVSQSVHPFSVGHQGLVTLLVPKADVPRARVLLLRIVRPPRR